MKASSVPGASVASPSSPAAIAVASSTRSTISSVASACEPALIARLDINVEITCMRLTTALCAVTGAVEAAASSFMATVAPCIRRQSSATDKVLESQEDEFSDTCKMFESMLHQSFVGDCGAAFLDHSSATINRMLLDTDYLPSVSSLLATAPSTTLSLVRASTRLQTNLDPPHCTVTMPRSRWLAREETYIVHVAVADEAGELVTCLSQPDVFLTFGSGTEGWEAECVSVVGNLFTLCVSVTTDGTDDGTLVLLSGDTHMPIMLKATACLATQAAAIAVCAAVSAQYASRTNPTVSADVITPMVTACTAALSSCTVTEAFVTTVVSVCAGTVSACLTCCDTGVLEAVMDSLAVHGVASSIVAAKGFAAVHMLVGNMGRPRADSLVLSSGGLDTMLFAMEAHPADVEVQTSACRALWVTSRAVSPSVLSIMRDSRAVELLRAAKANHPLEGRHSVMQFAKEALVVLAPFEIDEDDDDDDELGAFNLFG